MTEDRRAALERRFAFGLAAESAAAVMLRDRPHAMTVTKPYRNNKQGYRHTSKVKPECRKNRVSLTASIEL